jgi:hypothetical protein
MGTCRFQRASGKRCERLRGCASDPWRNFSAKSSCPNRREFIRKFVEFAPRGAFQARIPGDFSPFLAKPGIFIRRNIAF